MMNLVLIGISGSGKGTQAELLSKQYNIIHISTGELFRGEYEKKSQEGLAAYKYWNKGKWVPDEVTFALLKIYLDGARNGFILDGFPRTENQCKILDAYIEGKNQKINQAIFLKVNTDVALNRLLKRGEIDRQNKGKSRDDEKEKIIRQRFNSFIQNMDSILTYYRNKNILLEVNGERRIDNIFQEIIQKIEAKKS